MPPLQCGAEPLHRQHLPVWSAAFQPRPAAVHFGVSLPDPLPVFELLVQGSDELPWVCVGVRKPLRPNQELEFNIIHLNDTASPKTDSLPLNAVQVTQLDRDTVLIALQ
ncbi:mitogen-activated protein kinase kinase kinase kinase 5-like, partial [Polyodon spathula]|uniref:mitogen-activated protein kinase kinase kinase kinase 5-like n=1 Tax=Polyodon spathula TaxID=7913 RepID=UPI001B7F1F0B